MDNPIDLVQEALDILTDAYEPDQGQLRTQWDKDVESWVARAKAALQQQTPPGESSGDYLEVR